MNRKLNKYIYAYIFAKKYCVKKKLNKYPLKNVVIIIEIKKLCFITSLKGKIKEKKKNIFLYFKMTILISNDIFLN